MGLKNVVPENYETSDLYSWLVDKSIPVELLTAGTTVQMLRSRRCSGSSLKGGFHFPLTSRIWPLNCLHSAMSGIKTASTLRTRSGQIPRRPGAFSMLGGLLAPKEVLNLYSIDSIVCQNRNSARRESCFLMGGGLELHCSRDRSGGG